MLSTRLTYFLIFSILCTACSNQAQYQTPIKLTLTSKAKTTSLTQSPKRHPTFDKGLYLQQSIFEEPRRFKQLLKRAQQYHINSFIVDLDRMTPRTAQHIKIMHTHHMRYIARIVVFPHGGTVEQVNTPHIWQQHWDRIEKVLQAQADAIQLDYIRYRSDSQPDAHKTQKILQIIQWYKEKIKPYQTSLQAALFGVTAFHPSMRIGQDLSLFSNTLDVVCPMVYPSHWEPYEHYSYRPYRTVLNAVINIRKKLPHHPLKVIPYIEMYNYRIKHTSAETKAYILKQIHAAQDSGSDGWYAWSASNYYAPLFEALENDSRQSLQSE
ncbi:MAG: hypothetical protein CMF51_04545 [Legionellales bacterium]|nr:hypothetical protein [Legionellales bacterium]